MSKYRDFNPTTLNEGIFKQLKPDPFKLNRPFVEQLEPLIPLDSELVPDIQSSNPSSDLDFFADAKAISSPIDDIWQTDNFDIFTWCDSCFF